MVEPASELLEVVSDFSQDRRGETEWPQKSGADEDDGHHQIHLFSSLPPLFPNFSPDPHLMGRPTDGRMGEALTFYGIHDPTTRLFDLPSTLSQRNPTYHLGIFLILHRPLSSDGQALISVIWQAHLRLSIVGRALARFYFSDGKEGEKKSHHSHISRDIYVRGERPRFSSFFPID